MSKVTELSNDDGRLTGEVPVYAKLFQIDPVVLSQMVKFEGTMIQKYDEVVKEVVLEDVKWYVLHFHHTLLLLRFISITIT